MATNNLNYSTHTYLTLTLSPSSPFQSNPAGLASIHPALSHVGQVGAMKDIQILGVPHEEWSRSNGEIRAALDAKRNEGIMNVDVHAAKGRARRDEF